MELFEQLTAVGKVFRLDGKFYSFDTIKNGNINKTYKVSYLENTGRIKPYIFQKINTVVFKNPKEIMGNIDRVTSYIHEKYPQEITLHFHHTEEGLNYHFDSDGSFWRVMNYVESMTFNSTEDLAIIAATGEAFGHFQMQLADFDGSVLFETIPDFHNTKKRLDTLFQHVDEDPFDRVKEAMDEIAYIGSVRYQASKLSVLFDKGDLPVRVTHNDTKSNNVLFDKVTKRPLCVIDLDTVMPGMAIYDFADAVRFIANTSEEDEPDVRKVYFDTSKFRAFAKGFIGQVKGSFTTYEIEHLVDATFDITIELAARFLDDYLTGDKYFKVNYPGHNLVRTRCQLKLAQDMMKKYDELSWIIQSIMEN